MHIDQLKDIASGAASGALAGVPMGPVGMLQGATVMALDKCVNNYLSGSSNNTLKKQIKDCWQHRNNHAIVAFKIALFITNTCLVAKLMSLAVGTTATAALPFAAAAIGIDCGIWIVRAAHTLATDDKFKNSLFIKPKAISGTSVQIIPQEDAAKFWDGAGKGMDEVFSLTFTGSVDKNKETK